MHKFDKVGSWLRGGFGVLGILILSKQGPGKGGPLEDHFRNLGKGFVCTATCLKVQDRCNFAPEPIEPVFHQGREPHDLAVPGLRAASSLPNLAFRWFSWSRLKPQSRHNPQPHIPSSPSLVLTVSVRPRRPTAPPGAVAPSACLSLWVARRPFNTTNRYNAIICGL